jgi:hypothetical protein
MTKKQWIEVILSVPEGNVCSPIDCPQVCFGRCYLFGVYLNKSEGGVYEKCDACLNAKVVPESVTKSKDQMDLFGM